MKKLILIITLFISVMFSSTSFAKWTFIIEGVEGDKFYLDFDRMRKHSGNVFIWELHDYLKPDSDATLSEKIYSEVDCEKFRTKMLSSTFHSLPMGKGTPQDFETSNLNEWNYPSPGSVGEILLEEICSR